MEFYAKKLIRKYKNILCRSAVKKYGAELQKFVACEEMAELIQAISKDLRGDKNKKNIIEEIVDVNIMLNQLVYIYNISEKELDKSYLKKLSKLHTRINENK